MIETSAKKIREILESKVLDPEYRESLALEDKALSLSIEERNLVR